MNVFITGGNGFIGSHIVKAFCRNHEVTVLVRPGSSRDYLKKYPIKVVEGDLHSKPLLEEAFRGSDLVVHVAAKVGDWGGYPEFFAANVTGSLNVIEALSPGTKMIFISSCAVLGEEDCTIAKDVDAPYKPVLDYFLEGIFPSAMNHYRLTKALAEQMLIQRAEKNTIDLTVIRPVWVYGPREFHAGPYEYCETVQSGVPGLGGTSENLFPVIYAGDLARIVLRAAEIQPRGVEIFTVGHPDIPKMDAYWAMYCRALGVAKPFNLPKFLLYPLGFFLEALWSLLNIKSPPLLTRARVYMFYASNVYNVEKVVKVLGFRDFTPTEKGVRTTVRWWRMNGYLK